MSRAQTVCMSITGPAIVKIARDLMLSDEPGKAYRMIADGLDGEGNVQKLAQAILDGKKTLTGNSNDGIEMADEDPADEEVIDYKHDLIYLYAGRVKVDGSWWRPRSHPTSWGAEDARGASDRTSSNGAPSRAMGSRDPIIQAWYKARTQHYAGPGERVYDCKFAGSHSEDGKEFIIFEPCGELPQWWPSSIDVSVALEKFLAAGHVLEVWGWNEQYGRTTKISIVSEIDDDYDYEVEDMKKTAARKKAKEEREAEREAEYVRQDAERDAKYEGYRKEILARAGDQLFDLTYVKGDEDEFAALWEGEKAVDPNAPKVGETVTLKVPLAPFTRWALGRTSLRGLGPKWSPVSPSGLKMIMDDPFHTDWTLGAGIMPKDAYARDMMKAAHDKMYELQQQYGHFEVAVLVGEGEVIGTVGEDIVVLPDLHPSRLDSIVNAKCVITESGGQLSHLAQVALERAICIVRVSDAMKRYATGEKLRVDLTDGAIRTYYPPIDEEQS